MNSSFNFSQNTSLLEAEKVNIEPHYETLTNSGLYAYYDSGGYHSLYFAIGELIDNALSATLTNPDDQDKRIEVRVYKDSNEAKSVVMIVDNGHGMNKTTLTNWATYKLAKHRRQDEATEFIQSPTRNNSMTDEEDTRFLSGQISKFGAGGKESAFYIGKCVRVVTKNRLEEVVHTMELSVKDFEEKAKKNEKVYETEVVSRQPGQEEQPVLPVIKHVAKEEENKGLVKESFTYVIISDLNRPTDAKSGSHLETLEDLDLCARQLSDIYHFYLHGSKGDFTDDWEVKKLKTVKKLRNLNIILKLYRITGIDPIDFDKLVPFKEMNLRDVHNGMMTQYIRSAVSTFEFKGHIDDKKKFGGMLWYYSFKYDKETFPGDVYQQEKDGEDESETYNPEVHARGSRDIFVTYWNGRLIPYTTLKNMEFTQIRKTKDAPPEECYTRVAGVLFCDDGFKVTQNKLTFQDSLPGLFLYYAMKDTPPVFEYKDSKGSWAKRGIEAGFMSWLSDCHKKHDKKIKFLKIGDVIIRTDAGVTKDNQYPWTQFMEIESDKKNLKQGELIKARHGRSLIVGRVQFFVLQGDYTVDFEACRTSPKYVYGSRGFVAVKVQPVASEALTFVPLNRVDMYATEQEIHAAIVSSQGKLPHSLSITSVGYEKQTREKDSIGRLISKKIFIPPSALEAGQRVRAGENIGPFQIDILDKAGKSMSGVIASLNRKRIQVELKIFPEGADKPLNDIKCTNWSKEYHFWFDEMNNITKAGQYRLVIKSSIVKTPSQPDIGIDFPSYEIPFEVVANEPDIVLCPPLEGEAFRVGEPFDISLGFSDIYENQCIEAPKGFQAIIECIDEDKKDWEFQVRDVRTVGSRIVLKNIVGRGKVEGDKLTSVKITISLGKNKDKICPEVDYDPLEMNLTFKPGLPASLEIFPEDVIKMENGTLPDFGVKAFDICQNQVTKKLEKDLGVKVIFYEKIGGRKKCFDHIYFLDFEGANDLNGNPVPLAKGPAIRVTLGPQEEQKTIFAEISLKHPNESRITVGSVTKEVIVMKCTKPTDLRLYYTSEFVAGVQCEVRKDEELCWTAGDFIRDITFKMFDDSGNEITNPSLGMSNFRISWLRSDWILPGEYNANSLKTFKLPNIRAPRTAGEVSAFSVTYYDTSAPSVKSLKNKESDRAITFQFNVKSLVGPPQRLKVVCSGDDNKISAGEFLPKPIIVRLVDKFDNVISEISQDHIEQLQVTCESAELVESSLEKEPGHTPGDIEVTGINFANYTKLGEVNVNFCYEDLKGRVTLKVVAGPPKKLHWDFTSCEIETSGALPCVNGQRAGSWAFELRDQFDNVCLLPGIPVTLGWHKNMIGRCSRGKNVLTNEDGRAEFGEVIVEARGPLVQCPIKSCDGMCYDLLKVRGKADVPGIPPILSLGVKIHLKADPTLPVKFAIECDDLEPNGILRNDYRACGPMPAFTVRFIAENDCFIKKGNFGNVVMRLMCNDDPKKTGAAACTRVLPETGTVYFEENAPRVAGNYRIWFIYSRLSQGLSDLESNQIQYRVLPGDPATFNPLEECSVRTYVSNTSDRGKRRITDKLTFKLKDIHGNNVPCDVGSIPDAQTNGNSFNLHQYDGILVVSVEQENADSVIVLPKLEGDQDFIEVPIKRGVAEVDEIFLMEKSPGEDLAKYKLVFKPNFPSLETSLTSFEVIFGFVNEGAKHEQLLVIKTRQNELIQQRNVINSKRNEAKHQLDFFKREYDVAASGFMQFLNEVRRKHSDVLPRLTQGHRDINTEDIIHYKREIDEQLKRLVDQEEQESLSNRLARAPNEPDVLGKIAHLAKIENPRDNEVISWILKQDMDCIVTETVTKTKELQRRFGERQQFLPLELARRIRWDDSLPHLKCRQPFDPPGNPVFARDILRFVGDEAKCKIAFGGFLMDTILIDNMDDAMNYRAALVKQGIYCPTIVTRDGRRLASTGKLGGQGNCISNDFKQRGVRFDKTASPEITRLRSAIQDVSDFIDVSQRRDDGYVNFKRCEEEKKPLLDALNNQFASVSQQLKELEMKEMEVTRKRPGISSPLSNQPPLKRFC